MKTTWKQIKELPFSKKGSIWKVDGDELHIDGANYSNCHPDLWTGLVKYYTDEDTGLLDMSGEYFERAGTEDEKQYELKMNREYLESKKHNLELQIAGVEKCIRDLI